MSVFFFHEEGMHDVFESANGIVGQYLQRVGEAVVVRAEEEIVEATPFYPHDGPPFSISGELKRTIGMRVLEGDDGVLVEVGADTQNRGFAYPRELETGGASIYGTRFPWLSTACIEIGLDYRPFI